MSFETKPGYLQRKPPIRRRTVPGIDLDNGHGVIADDVHALHRTVLLAAVGFRDVACDGENHAIGWDRFGGPFKMSP